MTNSILHRIFGNVFTSGSTRRPIQRRRKALTFDILEARETPAVKTFAGLDFVAARFTTTAATGLLKSAVATTLRVEGSTVDLLKFEKGVSFNPTAGGDAFTALGDIFAVTGTKTLALFDTPATPIGQHTFDASDLLGATSGGTAFGAGNNAGVKQHTILGAPFTTSSIQLDASVTPPKVLLRGTFGVNLGPLGMWDVPMPRANAADPYVYVEQGVAKLRADVTFTTPAKSFSRKDWTFDLNPLNFALSSAAGNRFSLTGSANIKNPKVFDDDQGVLVKLGSQASATEAASEGIVVTSGKLTRFDMSIATDSSFAIKNLKFVPKGIHVVYEDLAATNTTPAQQVVSISGGAKFMKKDGSAFFAGVKEFDVNLGDQANNIPGVVVTNGELTTLHAYLTANQINFGNAVRLENPELALDYDATLGAYGITGGAKLVLPASDNKSFDVSLGSVTDHAPGILIENGELKRFDLAVASSTKFTLMGATIAPETLHFVYEETPNAQNPNQLDKTFVVSGAASVEFNAGGNHQSVHVALGDGNGETPGIVITNGELVSMHAVVNAQFQILKLNVSANDLTIHYQRDDDPSTPALDDHTFTLDGAVNVSLDSPKFNFDMTATLGSGQHHGIAVRNGELQGAYIALDGEFSLYGLSLYANGLTAQYDAAIHRLKLSGGVEVQLSNRIVFGASIQGGGLTIDTSTGELGIDTGANGLVIAGKFVVAGFVGVEAQIRYITSAEGYTLQGNGKVTLPLKTVVGASFTIHNGTLSQIGLSLEREIPLGTTGLYITRISGNIDNLDDPVNLKVNASVSVRFAKQVLGYDLFTASGNLEVTKDYLRVGGQVSLVNGILGSGRATIDINWTQGVYRLYDVEVSLLAGVVKLGGEFGFNSKGDISLRGFARVQVPDDVDYIGGIGIQLDFGLQVRPGGSSYDNFFAAWGSIDTVIFGTLTVGFRLNLDGSGLQVIWDAQAIAPIQPVEPIDVPATPTQFYIYEANLYQIDQFRIKEVTVFIQSDRFLEPVENWRNDYIVIPTGVGTSQTRNLGDATVPGRTANERKIVFKNTGSAFDPFPYNGKIKLISNLGPYLGATVRPKFTAAPIYKKAHTTQFTGTPGANPGSADFFMEAYSYAPGAAERLTISLVAQGDLKNDRPFDGQLLKTFKLGDPGVTYDPSNGKIQVHTTYNSLADLGPWDYAAPFHENGPYYQFVITDGGYPLQASYGQFPSVLIPDPTIHLDGRDWVASGTNQAHFNIQSSSAIDVPVTKLVMQLTPAGSGTVSQDDYYILPFSDTVELSGYNADGINYYLNNLNFDRSPTFTGKSTLTVTATQATASGKEYTTVKTIDFVQANAHLVVAAEVDDAHPVEGGEIFVTFFVTNQAAPNDRNANNVRLKAPLPPGLALIAATLTKGTYTPAQNDWFIGQLPVGETAQLTLQLRVLDGTFGAGAMKITGSVTANQLNLYPEDATETVSITTGTGMPVGLASASMLGSAVGNYYAMPPVPVAPGKTGSGGPYRYVMAGGALPPGLALHDDGLIEGRPMQAGSYAFQLDVYDRFGAHTQGALNTYEIRVAENHGTLGAQYFADFSAGPNGSKLPGAYTITLTNAAGQLIPSGNQQFFYYSSGTDAGYTYVTPQQPGYYTLKATRKDGSFTEVIAKTWWIENVDSWTLFSTGAPYDRSFTVGQAIAPEQFHTVYANTSTPIDMPVAYLSPNLPPGLTLSNDGFLTGTPTTTGSGVFFLYTLDASGNRALTTIGYDIVAGSLTLITNVPPAAGGQPYVARLQATGGVGGPYTFSAPDPLIDGLTLSPDGTLSGTMVNDTIHTFVRSSRVAVQDAQGNRTEAFLLFRVEPALVITNESLYFGALDEPYRDVISVYGGTNEGYHFDWSGNLPHGLSLNANTGAIFGTPTQRGRQIVNITVTDSAGASATKTFTLQVVNVVLPLGQEAAAQLEPNVYNPLSLNGQSAAPPGLTLTSDGQMTGVPTQKGTFTFSSKAASGDLDSGVQWVRQYTVVVSEPPTPQADVVTTRQDTPIDIRVLANDTDPNDHAFRIVSWGQPASGSLHVEDGVFTYTPNAGFSGSATFTYRVRNARGLESFAAVTINVTKTLIVPGLQSGRRNAALKFSAATKNQISLNTSFWNAGTVTVQLLVDQGKLSNVAVKGVTITKTQAGDRVRLVGTVANVNKALNGLIYTPAKNALGRKTLTINVSQSAADGELSAHGEVEIIVK